MDLLFDGYRPIYKRHALGWEVESTFLLSTSQQMCYYKDKLFGGYATFLMDRILVDSCKPTTEEPAFTAYLNTSFKRPIAPTTPIMLRAWPEKLDGRKTFVRGSVHVLGESDE
ncbi:hypothetical protein N7478_001372 [Penicillium angulare]|uniref:uncharacterized protein n=1 Tax=Penicillium angulare TaxID=116970 RepID=UPI0025410205|nr:uncharacterized protein N7478_001372 [Penicillium angulare]KAJ5292121.1 hypothetical protein N7478_001372 [Penicillium angulare]